MEQFTKKTAYTLQNKSYVKRSYVRRKKNCVVSVMHKSYERWPESTNDSEKCYGCAGNRLQERETGDMMSGFSDFFH